MMDDGGRPTLPPDMAPTQQEPVRRDTPRVVGSYRLLQRLGEGGMGEVWQAEQTEPVRRIVALKLIRKGMDSREVVARFESERQALALMDHPGIARVYDAGETENGRPYFVMEFVPGEPITDYCDRHKFGMRQRLELFMMVCEAIQHAHHKAIIHRDLKPSNVLVFEQDGKAVPKIIDFGVAKATSQRLTDKTMHTMLGQLIGTPEYMSPEQAEMTGQNVDTRTDVYALGVILYELLTGELPFDPEELRKAGYEGIRRTLLETEPPRPSARLTASSEVRKTRARDRDTDPGALVNQLKGDLDWITMKALEKDRTRRYTSPDQLARDIRRHLMHRPVHAGPPSALYRAQKFVRRHRVGVTIGAVIVVMLFALAVSMVVQANRIAKERDRANQEAETARQVSEFLVDLFEVSDPSEALGNAITAREILDRGAYAIRNELRDQPRVQARLMDTIGEVYRRLGLYDQARPLMEQAVEIQGREGEDGQAEVSRSLEHLGALLTLTGDYDEARTALERSLRIQEERGGPATRNLASILNNLGTLHLRTGDYDQAQACYDRALAIYEQVSGPDHPDVARMLNNLAILDRRQGEEDRARTRYERALRIMERAYGPEHPDVAQGLNNLASLLRSTGKGNEARPLYERSLAIREKVLGPDHPDVARSLNNLGILLEEQGEHAAALAAHQRALEIREAVLGPVHADVAQSLNNLAIVRKSMGDYDTARELYSRALEIRRQTLGDDHPRLALYYYNLAGISALAGARGEALRLLSEAVARGFDDPAIFDDPDLRSLRGDPEFEKILETVRGRTAGHS